MQVAGMRQLGVAAVALAALLGVAGTAWRRADALTVSSLETDKYTVCSLVSLIANPDSYHNRDVMVRGFLVVRFERNAIFLSEADHLHSVHKNGVWVDLGDKERELREASGRYVTLLGRYDASSNGHMNMYSGTISKVLKIVEDK